MKSVSFGVHRNIPMSVYQQWNALSYGPIRAVHVCPALAKHMIFGDKEFRSVSKSIGTAIHDAVFRPDYFDKEYAPHTCSAMKHKYGACQEVATVRVRDSWYCTRHGKLAGDSPDTDAPGVADQASISLCRTIRDCVHKHPEAMKLLDGIGDCEISYLWKDQKSELDLKCRPDAIGKDESFVVDLKTTSQPLRPSTFPFHAWSKGYFHQAAMALRALQSISVPMGRYFIIAVEINQPHLVAVFELDQRDIETASKDLDCGLKLLSECLGSGNWPGFDQLQTLRIPMNQRQWFSDEDGVSFAEDPEEME